MSADYLTLLRQKKEEKNAPSPNCINPAKPLRSLCSSDIAQKKVIFSEASQVIDSCRFCAHHRLLGIGNRYCGGRPDLPLAYGPGHPLRRLPADLGDSCQSFQLAEAYR